MCLHATENPPQNLKGMGESGEKIMDTGPHGLSNLLGFGIMFLAGE
jgi:hypothetical protein